MKIKLKEGVEYDDTKSIREQLYDVTMLLLPFIDSLGSHNCAKKDNDGRPVQWIFTIEGIEITCDRAYLDLKGNRKISGHTVKLKDTKIKKIKK